MYNAPEELLDRLALPDVSAATVMEYLENQAQALEDDEVWTYDAPEPSLFFAGETDLASYRAARAWWPKHQELPHALAFPSVYQLCWSYHEGPTFAERLTAKSMPVVKWLEANGIDISCPNESSDERKARLNREAQRRHRQSKGVAGTPEQQAHAQAVKQAYDAWQDLLAQRAGALSVLDDEVHSAEKAYHAICAKRKQSKADWDARIAAARKLHQNLKTGSASPE